MLPLRRRKKRLKLRKTNRRSGDVTTVASAQVVGAADVVDILEDELATLLANTPAPYAAPASPAPPADGFEDYRDVGYRFHGHPMLRARVAAANGGSDPRS